MSTSKISTSRHGRFLHSALAAAALLACSVVAQAADTAPAVEANATTTAKAEMSAKKVEKAVSDTWITTKVKSEILANSASKAFKVQVTTKSGVVSLNGKLPNKDAVDLVKMIAEKVKGVQSVDASGLTVQG